jgi:hypothetical protein
MALDLTPKWWPSIHKNLALAGDTGVGVVTVDRTPERALGTAPRQCRPGRRYPHVSDDFIRLIKLLAAAYGAYKSATTAWRLLAELLD